jgi:hypothetical protein
MMRPAFSSNKQATAFMMAKSSSTTFKPVSKPEHLRSPIDFSQ